MAIEASAGTFYPSSNVPLALNFGTLTSTLNVADSFLLTDVNISMNLSADTASNHQIYLISPSGTQVQLFGSNCNFGLNIIMTFDDEGAASIGSCTSGQSGTGSTFRPTSPLSAFDGQDSLGTWSLKVDGQNGFFSNNSVLNSWSLDLSTGSAGVPEPTTIGLTAAALAAIAYRMRRRSS